nr:hypothetical protein [Tanacetum cinerariifolium]
MVMPTRKLGSQGLQVSAIGFGCMSMSQTDKSQQEMIQLLHTAIDSGVTFLDTSDIYGSNANELLIGQQEMIQLLHTAIDSGVTFLDTSDIYGSNANELLIGQALKGGRRDKVQIATKFGITSISSETRITVTGDPVYVKEACNGSLKRLGVDCIDLYYIHRIDTTIPIEITLEWSLWTRDAEEQVIPTCRELGIGIIPFSPLGKGFFSSTPVLIENLAVNDSRRQFPRFQGENLEHNTALLEKVHQMAKNKGCTTSQLALAWVLYQGEDVCPIPGTTKIENFKENIGAVSVKLSHEDISELETIASMIKGGRYPDAVIKSTWKHANTPPLASYIAK